MPYKQKINIGDKVENKQSGIVYKIISFHAATGLYTCRNIYHGEICVYENDLIIDKKDKIK